MREAELLKKLEEREKAFNATSALNALVLQTLEFSLLAQRIANAIPQLFGYQTGVLALVDEKKGILKRIAISETSGGLAAVASLEIPFQSIEISLDEEENYCIKALRENKAYSTTNLYDVLRPVVSEANCKMVQNLMHTRTTLVYPIYSTDRKPLGTFLVSMDKTIEQVSEYEYQTIKNFVDGIRIALVNTTLYTSLSKTTEDLKAANEKLRDLDKLKDEFVSVASHELRTPMTAIKSYLWMALAGKGGELTEKQNYYLTRAYNSVDRLIKLVNDMLNVARIESGRINIEMKEININQVVQEVIDEVLPRAQELGLTFVVEYSDSFPKVLADGDKIKEVIFNLVGNSLKFTPQGGKITISFAQRDKMVEVKVSDTGSGIDPENLPKLFQKFGILPGSYTTNQSSFGTGLGLYISKSIVELHGGEIWVASSGKNKGTTFTFSLKVFNEVDLKNINEKSYHGTEKSVG